jgi:hypothetical protein
MDAEVKERLIYLLKEKALKLMACQYCGAYSFWTGRGILHRIMNETVKCCGSPSFWYVNFDSNDGYFNVTGRNDIADPKVGSYFDIRSYFSDKKVPMLDDSPWSQLII